MTLYVDIKGRADIPFEVIDQLKSEGDVDADFDGSNKEVCAQVEYNGEKEPDVLTVADLDYDEADWDWEGLGIEGLEPTGIEIAQIAR